MNTESVDLHALIIGCKKGDRRSQQKVYELYYRQMIAVSLRYTGNMDDAKDILHEGFIKVFTNISKYNDNGSFQGWIRRIISNTAIDSLRKGGATKIINNSDYIDRAPLVDEENYNWFEDNQISPSTIYNEIKNLPPAYRTAFNMFVIEGYSHAEIAEYLGITEGASKSNLSKAKAKLRGVLTEMIEKINS